MSNAPVPPMVDRLRQEARVTEAEIRFLQSALEYKDAEKKLAVAKEEVEYRSNAYLALRIDFLKSTTTEGTA